MGNLFWDGQCSPTKLLNLCKRDHRGAVHRQGQSDGRSLRRARLLSGRSAAGPWRRGDAALDTVTAQREPCLWPGVLLQAGGFSSAGPGLLRPPACGTAAARGAAVPGWLEAGEGFLAGTEQPREPSALCRVRPSGSVKETVGLVLSRSLGALSPDGFSTWL